MVSCFRLQCNAAVDELQVQPKKYLNFLFVYPCPHLTLIHVSSPFLLQIASLCLAGGRFVLTVWRLANARLPNLTALMLWHWQTGAEFSAVLRGD